MNLADYRTRIARVVGMSASDSDDLDLIDSWVNEGVVEFLKDTKVYQVSASLSVTAASGDYTLDDDILAMADLWYEPGDGSSQRMLEPVDSRAILDMRRYQAAASVTPMYYALQGASMLMLYPAPASSSDLLHLIYTPRPSSALSATADDPSTAALGGVPTEYHPIIEAYAKWKAAEAEEHKPSNYGLSFQAEYQKGVAETRSDMNRKAGVFKSRKIGGKTSRRRFPVTPGTDLR